MPLSPNCTVTGPCTTAPFFGEMMYTFASLAGAARIGPAAIIMLGDRTAPAGGCAAGVCGAGAWATHSGASSHAPSTALARLIDRFMNAPLLIELTADLSL